MLIYIWALEFAFFIAQKAGEAFEALASPRLELAIRAPRAHSIHASGIRPACLAVLPAVSQLAYAKIRFLRRMPQPRNNDSSKKTTYLAGSTRRNASFIANRLLANGSLPALVANTLHRIFAVSVHTSREGVALRAVFAFPSQMAAETKC